MGIGVLNDSPVKTPKDLEGRQTALTVTSGRISVPAGLRRTWRVRPSKVSIVQLERDRLPTPDWHVDCVVTGG